MGWAADLRLLTGRVAGSLFTPSRPAGHVRWPGTRVAGRCAATTWRTCWAPRTGAYVGVRRTSTRAQPM